ncbi:hypothetical protein SB783_35255 [Paraburkholderia sp. SIMBA_009]
MGYVGERLPPEAAGGNPSSITLPGPPDYAIPGVLPKIDSDNVLQCAQNSRHGSCFRDSNNGRSMMAKGQLRGNREAKKPKQPKKLLSPVVERASATTSKITLTRKPEKKK